MAQTEMWNRASQRSVPVWLMIACGGLVVARIITPQLAPGESPSVAMLVKWTSVQSALPLAQRTGKPILYDFSAEWCGPCKVMEREVFANARLAAMINSRFIPVRVIDRRQEDSVNPPEVDALQKRYGIHAFPTVVIADAKGVEKSKMIGYQGGIAFEHLLQR